MQSELTRSPSPERTEFQSYSADLEKLLQKAEFENSQLVKQIEEEDEKCSALQRNSEESVRKTEQFEKLTTELDEEAKQLHKQFKQSRDICESLNRTSQVLNEHEEALQSKLENAIAKSEQIRSDHSSVEEKYEKTWQQYFANYESSQSAAELSKIKQRTQNVQEEVKKLERGIEEMKIKMTEMEDEKRKLQETAKTTTISAKISIIKLAQIYDETTKTVALGKEKSLSARKVREVQGIIQDKIQIEKTTIKEVAATTVHDAVTEDAPILTKQDTEGCRNETESEWCRIRESQDDNNPMCTIQPKPAMNRLELHVCYGANSPLTRTTTVASSDVVVTVNAQENENTDTTSSNLQVTLTEENCHLKEPSSSSVVASNTQAVGAQSAPNPSMQATILRTPGGSRHKGAETESRQQIPTTPGNKQVDIGTEPQATTTQSPFNLETQTARLQQISKSPGEGFMYASRPMFSVSDASQANNQQQTDSSCQNIFLQSVFGSLPDGNSNKESEVTKKQDFMFGAELEENESAASDAEMFFFGQKPSENAKHLPSATFQRDEANKSSQENRSDGSSAFQGFSMFEHSGYEHSGSNNSGFSFSFGCSSPSDGESSSNMPFSLF